jgi:glycine oxidase
MSTPDRADVVVIGGGAIGLAIAWQARLRGLEVTLVDPDPGQGASWLAAGMLAPVSEAHYGEEGLLALNLASARRWPSFAQELYEDTGLDLGYRDDGTLVVAADEDDLRVVVELHRYLVELGLSAERLQPQACRRHEPLLAPRIRGGMWVAGDHQIDNRRLVRALLVACEGAGVVLRKTRGRLLLEGGRAAGVDVEEGEQVRAGAVVVASGWSTPALVGLPPEAHLPVRPVKGQILRLRHTKGAELPRVTVRGFVRGSSVYLVPRADGELVVGATVEERGVDSTVTAGGVLQLLRDAVDIVPMVSELELVEARAGLRPATPDNAPFLGPTAVPGLIAACGHYRNGILLTPISADAIAELVATGHAPDVIESFVPTRLAAPALASAATEKLAPTDAPPEPHVAAPASSAEGPW